MNWRNPWLLLLLIFVLSTAVQLDLPWWSMAVVAFALGFSLVPSGGAAFGAGFGGAGLSWLVPAVWLAYLNEGLLAHRVAQLLPLGGSAVVLVLVTGVVAGLVGGVAALAGTWLRQAVRPAPQAS
ncbi:hypothetical protein Q3A66_04960 [Hymenobacter sp. BT770]|uniref:hypothetical protein n=1 Tax=Hymenobacter sp. BT770 TaxID=2886942 RepID=UPI001D0FEC42|nr:hypothetical protein [Hymenobacter sp. BT770]MCC3154146.1 hypothetical protein [Hymenobacter sp. BT770]MDO3414407.1 hypothetical protein [Hymenobacter sp. BT770]